MKITLYGGFHNSPEITIVIKADKISVGQYRRLSKHFCGINRCICGGAGRAEIIGLTRSKFHDMLENAAYLTYPR